MKHFAKGSKRLLSVLLSSAMVVSSCGSVSAGAAEKKEANFARALQYSIYFYDGNMCGTEVQENNRYSWRGDCHTYDAQVAMNSTATNLSADFLTKYKDVLDPDGDGYIDVAGGFHDAGDHVKFGMPENYSAATLGWGYYEFRDAYEKTGQNDHIETTLRYFNDYLMKCTFLDSNGDVIAHCYQVGDGDIDHAYWNAPELDEMDRPAYFLTADKPQTDYVASAAASLAINYLNFKDTDPEYAQKSLDYATALYKFAETHDKELSDNGDGPKSYYNSSKWEDDYCWASAWMYKITGDHHYLEQIFPMMGIRFIAINDNYDNANTESSDSDSIVVPFKNLLNDSYCRDISIKVRSQLDIKRRKGEFIGGYAMYGYCKDERNKSRLVVDEYAAEVVRSIYRRKLEGMSAKAIAEQLNSEGVLAPSEYKRLCGLNYHSGFKAGTHAKWQAIQVLRILKNEVYTGTMVQGKRQKINYKIKKIRDVEESGWIKVPNMHEAIIPQKLFDTVQEVLKLDTCASKGQQTVNLFSGMVRCGGCGQNMVRRTVSKNGKKYVYLHCITNHNGLGCSSHLISESKLAEVVLAALQGKIQQISGLEQRLDEINEIPKNQRRLKSVEEHMKMLEQEEQKYQTLRRQLYEDMSNGIVSKDEYKEFSRSFNEKVENIRKAKTEMNRQLDSLNNLDVEHLPWIEDFKSYQNLTSLNRRVLVELVESITVYDKEHIHIQYRFDQEIRNVLEYCNSVPTTETEGSTV